jgi:hypothetical protein
MFARAARIAEVFGGFVEFVGFVGFVGCVPYAWTSRGGEPSGVVDCPSTENEMRQILFPSFFNA